MTPSVEQVLTAALDLPDDDRLELVEALIVSLQPPDQPPFDDPWRSDPEAIRRVELRPCGPGPLDGGEAAGPGGSR